MNENKTKCSPHYTFTKESTFYNSKSKEGKVIWEPKMCSFIISSVQDETKATKIAEVEVNMAEYVNSGGDSQRIDFDSSEYPGLYIEVRWLICEKSQY